MTPAQAAALASQQQLAATKAALAQVKAQRLASSQAFAAQLAQSAAADFAVSQSSATTPASASTSTDDSDSHGGGGSRAADAKSGYLSGTDVIIDVLGAISASRMGTNIRIPVTTKVPTRALPTMSSGTKLNTITPAGAIQSHQQAVQVAGVLRFRRKTLFMHLRRHLQRVKRSRRCIYRRVARWRRCRRPWP